MSKELEIMKEERERLVQEDYADICIEECDLVIKALQRLESIDNANPSEALECLEKLKLLTCDFEWYKDNINTIQQALLKAEKEHNSVNLLMQELDCKDFAELRKYARCGYEKLNKKYLKWEDLEFKEEGQIIKVILNGSKYKVAYFTDGITEYVDLLTDGEKLEIIGRYVDADSHEKQFFNDLHLERVEE